MVLKLDRYIKSLAMLLLLCLPMVLMAVEYNIHRVQRGDTLYGLSRRYGVSVNHIKRLNNLTSDNLSIGQRLKISEIRAVSTPTPTPAPTPPPPVLQPSSQPQVVQTIPRDMTLPAEFYHTVAQGEGLYRIAVNNSITLADLLRFNGFADSSVPIRPGDRLIIKDPSTAQRQRVPEDSSSRDETPDASGEQISSTRPIGSASSDTVVVEQVYIVQRGDTLFRIATNHGLSVDELKRRNNLSTNDINVGQRLYIVGTPSSRPPVSTAPVVEGETERLRNDLANPVPGGRVTSHYGIRNGRPHKGIDISARTGTPIFAVLDGTVVFSGVQGGYGNVIVMEHPNFVMTIYAHNERNMVSVGDVVTKGQQIATVGSTGDTTGPHLHFEYRIKGKPINPVRVLPVD